ncbi:hypothetical protein BJ878DRAFT_541980 [Calycina marina]|uniref:Uncharacterized protein n=1 Tax=Calycina marina TaxID=1763456 RepID=A0A9P7Z4I8_9HELO|nr:hypothetical protein BJ878DRAFT_541980 [Calycina marina]
MAEGAYVLGEQVPQFEDYCEVGAGAKYYDGGGGGDYDDGEAVYYDDGCNDDAVSVMDEEPEEEVDDPNMKLLRNFGITAQESIAPAANEPPQEAIAQGQAPEDVHNDFVQILQEPKKPSKSSTVSTPKNTFRRSHVHDAPPTLQSPIQPPETIESSDLPPTTSGSEESTEEEVEKNEEPTHASAFQDFFGTSAYIPPSEAGLPANSLGELSRIPGLGLKINAHLSQSYHASSAPDIKIEIGTGKFADYDSSSFQNSKEKILGGIPNKAPKNSENMTGIQTLEGPRSPTRGTPGTHPDIPRERIPSIHEAPRSPTPGTPETHPEVPRSPTTNVRSHEAISTTVEDDYNSDEMVVRPTLISS